MKKEYISPEVNVIELKAQSILCTSVPLGGEENDGFAREDNNFDEPTPNRPGNNVWDQGW